MNRFENYLKNIPIKQKYLIYMMPLFLFGAQAMMLTIPSLESDFEMLESQNTTLLANIERKSPEVLKKKIEKEKSTLLSAKEEAQETHEGLQFLYAKLTNLEILEFNEQQWTLTLDDILKKSLGLDLKIQHIKNSDSEHANPLENIVPKKYVEIKGSGNYGDILKFLDFIENIQFLVDMKNINIEHKADSEKIDFHFNFTIYGVNI